MDFNCQTSQSSPLVENEGDTRRLQATYFVSGPDDLGQGDYSSDTYNYQDEFLVKQQQYWSSIGQNPGFGVPGFAATNANIKQQNLLSFWPTPNYEYGPHGINNEPKLPSWLVDPNFSELAFPSIPGNLADMSNTPHNGPEIPSWSMNSNASGPAFSSMPGNLADMGNMPHNGPGMPTWLTTLDVSEPAFPFMPGNLVNFSDVPPNDIDMTVPPQMYPQSNPGQTIRVNCTFLGCNKAFKRESDRVRHEKSAHLRVPGVHFCPVFGCSKSQGTGFSRPDKVTEHLWKKHGDLGYARAKGS